MNNALFFSMRILAWIVLNFLFWPKVTNAKNLHFSSKCIVIANHTSNWDPILLGHLVFPVNLRYMAKDELFKNGFLKAFLLGLGVIPVSRKKSDLKAMKTALTALKNGQSLGLFPEGHRSKTGEMLPFEIGAAVIALKTNTPVLPVYFNCRGYRPFRRVSVTVGEMLDLNKMTGGKTNGDVLAEMTETLYKKMTELKESGENGRD